MLVRFGFGGCGFFYCVRRLTGTHYVQTVKLKKSRKDRVCHLCSAAIAKGDQYAVKTVRISGKATQDEKDAAFRDHGAVLIETVSVSRPVCACCAG